MESCFFKEDNKGNQKFSEYGDDAQVEYGGNWTKDDEEG